MPIFGSSLNSLKFILFIIILYQFYFPIYILILDNHSQSHKKPLDVALGSNLHHLRRLKKIFCKKIIIK